MVEVMLHERFYTAGIWADESAGVYVGWIARRDSFCDRMPLRNERGDVVLAYSGEDFPEPGTAQFLKERGHELDVAGPSYIVHLYEESPSFPARLNGRFHGLLIDQNRKSAVLFNDRFGMHRLCYHEANDGFYFAGEAKAILAVRPELRSIDSTGLAEFVSCGAVLENRTIFEKIHALPPASAWVFQNGSLQRKSSYFHPSEWEGQETLDRESYYNELRETFTRNLPRYFTGQERMGMSLTGGLDTRMILAARNAAPGSLPCYTFGSMFRKNQDVRVASRVAEACKQPHEVITAGHEFLSHFKHYAERAVYLTDGCVDVGRAPDLYLNERAREVAPVRMTGNYGGEILRGVRAFKPVKPATGLFVPEFSSHLRQAAETYAETTLVHPVSFSAFRQAPWYHHGVLALEQTQLSVRSPYLDNDFVQTVFRSPRWALAKNDVSLRLIADASPALLRIPTDRGLAGDRSRVTTAIHRGFLEFLFKAEYACDMGMPQWLARLDHIVSPFRLEQLFLGRHKVFHFRAWYRDTLGPYLQETLLDRRSLSRSFLQRTRVETVVRRHLKGHRNYTNEIHKLLTLEMIHRLFIDGRERSGFEEQPKTHTQPIRVSVPS